MSGFNYFDHQREVFGGEPILGELREPVKNILEAAVSSDGVAAFGDQQTRSACMACCLSWIEGGDFSFDAINAACFVMADMDEDGDLSPEEEDEMNACMQGCADAFISLGADPGNVSAFLDEEDDAAGATLGAYLSDKVANTETDDDTIIANYAVGGEQVLESMVKVVRSGKVVLKRKRIGRPKKITAQQRASLAKARRRAFSGAARVARAKSMKIRKNRGM